MSMVGWGYRSQTVKSVGCEMWNNLPSDDLEEDKPCK